MRTLHILPSCDNNRVENYAVDVILGLQKVAIEQCVIINRRSPYLAMLEKAGVKTLLRPFYAARWPLQRLWFAKRIAQVRPHLAHCWTRNATQLIPPNKIPVVGWFAGYDSSRHLTHCTHIVSASRGSALRFAKKTRPGTQTRFIPAFLEFSEMPPLDRHRLATPRDAKVLLSFAPLQSGGQIHFLLAALKNLPDCILWLAGEGPSRYAIEKSASDAGVIGRVRFAASGANPFALLRAADLCLAIADSGSFSKIVPKAWAAGTPVVVDQRADFDSPLEDGVTGLAVPFGDGAALARAVRQVLDEDILRGRLIAKGYAAWLSTYTREAVIRQWVEFYKEFGVQGSGFRD